MTSTDAIAEAYGPEVADAMRGTTAVNLSATMPRRLVGWVKLTGRHLYLTPSLIKVCQMAADKRCVPLEQWLGEAIWTSVLDEEEQSEPPTAGGVESVRQWFDARVVARSGSKLRPKAEAYLGSYLPWCAERGIEPVSLTRFGIVMKDARENGGCGVTMERSPGKRDCYLGIALAHERATAP